jgi:hypothetical protein
MIGIGINVSYVRKACPFWIGSWNLHEMFAFIVIFKSRWRDACATVAGLLPGAKSGMPEAGE